ncbi:MAG: glycosyltransferase [Candidatus Saccharicenans sp.]|nr:glycosyltransferase [Candidatus Saccharicenans sp.]
MKILHVLTSFEPAWAVGGSITAHSNLCHALQRLGHEVTVYASNADGLGGQLAVPLKQPVDLDGLKVWYFPYELGRVRAFYSRSLLHHLKETASDFEVIHLAGLWQYLCVAASSIVKKQGLPSIITPHSSLMAASFYGVGSLRTKKFYWNLFGKKAIKNATAVHFLSEGERQDSEAFTRGEASFIVPNGIFTDRYERMENLRVELRKKLNLPEKALVLLFLGRLHPKKQIDLIIKALPAVLKQRPDVFLLLVGPPGKEEYVNNLKNLAASLGLEKQVIWAGLIDHHETPAFYSASDLMVLPSLAEGVSMALTEAMAASLPLLITNRVANWVEIEQDGAGLVVEPVASEVEKALVRLATDPTLLATLSRQAKESARKRYDISQVAPLMLRAYQDVITGERSPELNWQQRS